MEATIACADQDDGCVAPKKQTCKVLSKKEWEGLVEHMSQVDPLVLTAVVNSKLREQFFREFDQLSRYFVC